MRQRGLGNVQFLQKDTGTFLPASQEIYNLHAMLIAKRFEHSYVLFIQFQNHCLLESNFVDMFILVQRIANNQTKYEDCSKNESIK